MISDRFTIVREVGRHFAAGRFAPQQIRAAIDREETEQRLRAVVSDHWPADQVLEWLHTRPLTWEEPIRTAFALGYTWPEFLELLDYLSVSGTAAPSFVAWYLRETPGALDFRPYKEDPDGSNVPSNTLYRRGGDTA